MIALSLYIQKDDVLYAREKRVKFSLRERESEFHFQFDSPSIYVYLYSLFERRENTQEAERERAKTTQGNYHCLVAELIISFTHWHPRGLSAFSLI